jgi:hypothetical protein
LSSSTVSRGFVQASAGRDVHNGHAADADVSRRLGASAKLVS